MVKSMGLVKLCIVFQSMSLERIMDIGQLMLYSVCIVEDS